MNNTFKAVMIIGAAVVIVTAAGVVYINGRVSNPVASISSHPNARYGFGGRGGKANSNLQEDESKLICCQPMNKTLSLKECKTFVGMPINIEECLGFSSHITGEKRSVNIDGQGGGGDYKFNMDMYTCGVNAMEDTWQGSWDWTWNYTNNVGTHTESDNEEFKFTPNNNRFTIPFSYGATLEGFMYDDLITVKVDMPGEDYGDIEAVGHITQGGGEKCAEDYVPPEGSDSSEDI